MPSSDRSASPPAPWLCCQIGAREHYAVARGLHARGLLAGLMTDAWVPPRSAALLIPGARFRRLRERYRPELDGARVEAFTRSLLAFELGQRAHQRGDYWTTIVRRNEWFQDRVLKCVAKSGGFESVTRRGTVFAYSYAARRIFAAAKKAGRATVLGQIDPGPVEEEIVTAHELRVPEFQSYSRPAPTEYWQRWREECGLADYIVVNSQWSFEALERAGIDPAKLHLVPLAHELRALVSKPKHYPAAFTRELPLRVLFLGSAIVRKGIAEVLAASRLLADSPIEFHFVGPLGVEVGNAELQSSKVHWHGPVQRSATDEYYQAADVFLFPTHSDGFGLTQLEAQAWGLPIVASKHCGEVVVEGETGRVLPEVSAEAIAAALTWCLENPLELARMSAAAAAPDPRFNPQSVIDQLVELTASGR